MNDSKTFYAEVGKRVREARDKSGLTQEALATQVSLTRVSITNIEKGRQKILLHTFVDIATALHVEPTGLLPIEPSNTDSRLDELVKGLPEAERDWVKSTVASRNIGKKKPIRGKVG